MTMTPADRADVDPACADDPAHAWAEVLRDYRAALRDQRFVLSHVHDDRDAEPMSPPQPFTPPAGLPPLPDSLHDEAIALDAETTELLHAARELLAQLRPPTTAPVHRSILAPPSPSQMDTRL